MRASSLATLYHSASLSFVFFAVRPRKITLVAQLTRREFFAAEQQRKREGIERQSGRELRGLKPACREMFLPLAEALGSCTSELTAVRAVSNPVHATQRRVVEGILTQVIFQDNVGARNTRGFAKKAA